MNENLSVRLRSVDDGRSSLVYELSNPKTSRDKQRGEIDGMQMTIGELKESLGDSERQRRNVEARPEETNVAKERLTAELREARSRERQIFKGGGGSDEPTHFHRRTLQGVEDENMYECSFSSNQVATLSKSELSWLRSQERLLGETKCTRKRDRCESDERLIANQTSA